MVGLGAVVVFSDCAEFVRVGDIKKLISSVQDAGENKKGVPTAMVDWSLTSLQPGPIKIGARVMHHSRANTFQLVEVAV